MKRIQMLLVLAAMLAIVLPASAEVVRLQDGRLLQGKIVGHNGVELTLLRWDTGGQVTIPFKEMLQTDRKRIEEKLGYRSLENFKMMVSAHRLTLKKSTVRVIGVLDKTRSNDKTVVIVRRGINYRYDRSQVSKLEPVKVAATEVYTPKKIYEIELAKCDENARSHHTLALFAESLGLLEEAVTHYKKASELDPTNWKIRTDAAIARLEGLIENRDALKAYKGIISATAQHEYEKAREQLTAIQENYPDVEFPKSFDEMSQEIDAHEADWLNKQMLRNLHITARSIAWEFARQRTITIDQAIQYGRGQMQKDVMAKIATKLGIDDKRATQVFATRDTKHTQKLNLGSATFLLNTGGNKGNSGKGAGNGGRYGSSGDGGTQTIKIGGQTIQIPKGMFGGGGDGGSAGGGRGGGRGGNKGGKGAKKKKVDPKLEWWLRADLAARRSLIYAAWVIKNCEIVREDLTACVKCRGRGVMTAYTTQGAQQQVCNRCWGTRADKTIVYK